MYNITNYYSVTGNIFQHIVDFWHILLANDDVEINFTLAVCMILLCSAFLLVVRVWECA